MVVIWLLIGSRANKEGGRLTLSLSSPVGSSGSQGELLPPFFSPTLTSSFTPWTHQPPLFQASTPFGLSLHSAIRNKQLVEESPSSLDRPSLCLSQYGANEMLRLHFDCTSLTEQCQSGAESCELISERVWQQRGGVLWTTTLAPCAPFVTCHSVWSGLERLDPVLCSPAQCLLVPGFALLEPGGGGDTFVVNSYSLTSAASILFSFHSLFGINAAHYLSLKPVSNSSFRANISNTALHPPTIQDVFVSHCKLLKLKAPVGSF